MSKRTILLAALSAAALALIPAIGVAGTADSSAAVAWSEHHRVLIGFELRFTGPDTTSGSFVASGAVQDAGTSTVQDITLVPFGRHDQARLSGEQTFRGAHGAIVTHFNGIASAVSSPHQSGRGQFTVLSGTDAYAGIHGRGTFTIIVDAAGNHLIGTEAGHVH
jgi:hypothetical protein